MMDLSNYTGLQAAVADYLNRSDLTNQIPAFIVLAEAKIRRQVRRKTVRTDFDVYDEVSPLPDDCAELRTIIPVTGSPSQDAPLRKGTLEMVAEARQRRAGAAGRPEVFAVVGSDLVVGPAPDDVYTYNISYYQSVTPLASADDGITDLLTEAPDLYLYGALVEASPFLQHDERIPVWKEGFDEAVAQINLVRQREEFGASLSPARLPVVF